MTRTNTGSLVSAAPATLSVETNGTHVAAPRSTSVAEDQRVVTSADSMWSRNGGDTRPSNTSGTAHHTHTAAESGSHHAARRPHVRPGRCMAHHRIAGRHATAVATALTAPIRANASAAPAPPRRGDIRPCSTRITGSSTHGANATGQTSEEMEPRSPSIRGASAYRTPATARVCRVPIRSADATRTTPTNATVSRTAHHRRCVSQAGSPTRSNRAKKGPCGKR